MLAIQLDDRHVPVHAETTSRADSDRADAAPWAGRKGSERWAMEMGMHRPHRLRPCRARIPRRSSIRHSPVLKVAVRTSHPDFSFADLSQAEHAVWTLLERRPNICAANIFQLGRFADRCAQHGLSVCKPTRWLAAAPGVRQHRTHSHPLARLYRHLLQGGLTCPRTNCRGTARCASAVPDFGASNRSRSHPAVKSRAISNARRTGAATRSALSAAGTRMG